MNLTRNDAAAGSPPRLKSNHCGKNATPADSLNQSLTLVQRKSGGAMCPDISHKNHLGEKQLEILKNSICKGLTNSEFEVFIMACVKTQLDPFMKQIYAVKRKSKKPDGSWGEVMSIQTGIDGYRLIAERTDCYAPGPEPTYEYDDLGNLVSATAYIKKQTKDGTWHEVSASAYLNEYMQTSLDKQTGEKKPIGMWVNMPRTMLAKCAESQALRKAFPAEMSGVYTKEEMEQSEPETHSLVIDSSESEQQLKDDTENNLTSEQISEWKLILDGCEPDYIKWTREHVQKIFKDFSMVPLDMYERLKNAAIKNREKYQSKLLASEYAEAAQ